MVAFSIRKAGEKAQFRGDLSFFRHYLAACIRHAPQDGAEIVTAVEIDFTPPETGS